MTEKEKMLAGQMYDSSDPELSALRHKARRYRERVNQEMDGAKRSQLMKEWLGKTGEQLYVKPQLPSIMAVISQSASASMPILTGQSWIPVRSPSVTTPCWAPMFNSIQLSIPWMPRNGLLALNTEPPSPLETMSGLVAAP